MGGITGRLYQQFAITIAISVLLSVINALTLSPALAAMLLKPATGKKSLLTPFYNGFNKVFGWSTDRYVSFAGILARKMFRSLAFIGILVYVTVMDLPSREKWYEYSIARDAMLKATDTKHAPWYLVRSDDKKRARLNVIAHLLKLIPHKKVDKPKVKLPDRSKKHAYDDEATIAKRNFVPDVY